MAKNWVDWTALILLVVGGLNWGLSVFGWNLVASLFGAGVLAKIVYALVGLAALYEIYYLFAK